MWRLDSDVVRCAAQASQLDPELFRLHFELRQLDSERRDVHFELYTLHSSVIRRTAPAFPGKLCEGQVDCARDKALVGMQTLPADVVSRLATPSQCNPGRRQFPFLKNRSRVLLPYSSSGDIVGLLSGSSAFWPWASASTSSFSRCTGDVHCTNSSVLTLRQF